MDGKWVRQPRKDGVVVFVHGILSSGESGWQNESGAYWPELLRNESTASGWGIYVYSYQTGFFSGAYSLNDVVDDLKERFLNLDHLAKHRRIVFVCHSMGGIVVRKFLVERVNDFLDHNIEVGLFLLASPSMGSDYANWLAPLAKFLGHTQADALRFSQKNIWLNDLDKEFRNLKESRRLHLTGKELIEDKFVVLKRFIRKQVVEPFSGARYFGEPYRVPGSDHFSIAKPPDKQAVQHRLLLAFLEKLPNSSCTQNQHVSPIPNDGSTYQIRSDAESDYRALTDQSDVVNPPLEQHVLLDLHDGRPQNEQSTVDEMHAEIAEQRENGGFSHSRQELIDLLAEQFQRPDLQNLISRYVFLINKNFKRSFADQHTDHKDLATYLVNQVDDETRRLQVLHLLDAIDEKSSHQAAEELLAYLLHTFVRADDVNAKAINHVPFNYSQTLDLLSASRHNQALIPDYADAEFSNGRQKSDIYDHSHCQPPSGQWNKDRECREIAKALLRSLADPKADSDDAMDLLSGRLRAYDTNPQNRPIKGIRIHQSSLDSHPLANSEIADYFFDKFGRYLPVFVYGDASSGDEKDYLYVNENDIRGMLVERVASHRIGVESKPAVQLETSMRNQPSIIINNVVNSSGTAIGDNITQVIDSGAKQALTDELATLINAADQDDQIGKKQYAEIIAAADTLANELAKPKADKSMLANAAKTLEGFKNIATITTSIEKISQFLLPLIS